MRSKNSYGKMKCMILLRTILITGLAVIVCYGLLTLLVDGIFQNAFAKLVVRVFEGIGVDHGRAQHWYELIFIENRTLLMTVGFGILFVIFFYISIGRMTHYLNDISDEIDNILFASDEPVSLDSELAPMEEKLSELKTKLRRREMEAVESEQRKNELVVYLAHDLKTPLTSVIAYLTMLDERPDMAVEERAKYTHITLEKAIRLGELINEFFEIHGLICRISCLRKKN